MKSYAELKALIEQRGVHAEFGDAGEGFAIEQNPHELATFLVRMQELGVQSVLEIGTGYKGGLSRFLAAEMGWQVTSVDVEDYGHKFPGVDYRINHYDDPRMTHVSEADLIFIDGDHGYKSVKSDYKCYGRWANKVIAFHDICGLRYCQGVRKFWSERDFAGIYKKINISQLHSVIATEKQSGIGWIEL